MELSTERNFYEQLGKRIKIYRLKANLSQVNLASKLSLSRTSIVNIERGRQHPSLYQLYIVADSLNISLQELLPPKKDVIPNVAVDITTVKDFITLKGFIEDVKNKNS